MTLALLAATCWGFVNVYDKIILNNSTVKIPTRQLIDSVVGILIATPFLAKLSSPSIILIIIGILAGIIVFTYNYLYYRALQEADVSAVSVYLQSIPIFSSAIGFIFFSERFPAEVYFGALLILLGAVLVAIERTSTGKLTVFLGKNISVLMKFMLPASLIMSVNYGLSKLLLVEYSYWEVFFWGRIGFSSFGIFWSLVSLRVRKIITEDFKTIEFKTVYHVILIELLNFLGIFLLIASYATGTITLVSTVAAIQPLIVVIVVVSVAILKGDAPLKDFSSSRRVLFARLLAILLQIAGMILLYSN